jgi:hypothetical protein
MEFMEKRLLLIFYGIYGGIFHKFHKPNQMLIKIYYTLYSISDHYHYHNVPC